MRKVKIKDLEVGDTIYCKNLNTLEAVKKVDYENNTAKTFILQYTDEEYFEPNFREIYYLDNDDEFYLVVR